MPRREISDAMNRRAAQFLRDMADLVETHDVHSLDFRRDTEYFYLFAGRRLDEEPPAREQWTIVIDVERDQTRDAL